MDYVINTLENLVGQTAFANLTLGNYLMILVGCLFLYLAIKKEYEPLLLVPIAFGMILVNIYPISWRIQRILQTVLAVCYIIFTFWMSGVSYLP